MPPDGFVCRLLPCLRPLRFLRCASPCECGGFVGGGLGVGVFVLVVASNATMNPDLFTPSRLAYIAKRSNWSWVM